MTNCHGLKMQAADGKMRMTDVLDTKGVLRLIQSIPSPKAEPFKLWLAQVGSERLDEISDPEKAFARGVEYYRARRHSEQCEESITASRYTGKRFFGFASE